MRAGNSAPDRIQESGEADACLGQLLLRDGRGGVLVIVAEFLVELRHGRAADVVRTRSDWARRLDRDGVREAAVHGTLRELMAFPRPGGKIRRLRFPRGFFRAEFLVEFFRDLRRRLTRREALDDFDVPHFMKIGIEHAAQRLRFDGRAIEESDGDAVPAEIVVRRGVQRLMNVAHEMDQIAQSIGAGLWRGLGLTEDADFIGEGARDAARLGWAIP